MQKTCVLLLLIATCVFAQTSSMSANYISQFDGYKVVRAILTTQQQVDVIVKEQMDVWSGDSWALIGENDIMVSPQDLVTLQTLNVAYEIIVPDVAATIRDEINDNLAARSNAKASWFDLYHIYDEIQDFAASLAQQFPNLISFEPSIGQSIEGRDIGLLELTGGKGPKKGKLLLLGGQHAREWISPATVSYIANKLVTGYGVDSAVTTLVDAFDFVFIPVLNADGYVWTWTSYRLWRKNRRLNSDRSYGVDLNRNWGNHWCESGASRTPSSDTYCGTGPFSEPEGAAIQNVSLTYGPFAGAIDFHSYGQLIMRPYGWSSTPPNNNAQLEKVGDGMRAAMIAATGTTYTNQAIWQLYLSSGSSADYWHDDAKIPLSFGFEARDTGRYGFELPANQIVPSGEENFAALAYLASQVTP